MRNSLIILFSAALCGCSTINVPVSFDQLTRVGGKVRLVAWARVKGEILLFPNELAMRNLDSYPNCVSAKLRGDRADNLEKYDRHKVAITGQVVTYSNLKNDGEPLFGRRILDGETAPNACLGDIVILLDSIKLSYG